MRFAIGGSDAEAACDYVLTLGHYVVWLPEDARVQSWNNAGWICIASGNHCADAGWDFVVARDFHRHFSSIVEEITSACVQDLWGN